MKTYLFIFVVVIACFARPVYSQTGEVAAHSLGTVVNSKVGDFAPFVSKDGLTLYFISSRSLSRDHIFISKRKSRDSAWSEAEFFQVTGNPTDIITSVSFDGAGRMYFATTKEGVRGNMNIWQGFIEGTKVTAKELPDPVNTTKFEGGPSATKDGNEIYFSSNRDNPAGAMKVQFDIFVTRRNSDGTWTQPQNLGPKLNIGRWNGNPFITPDGKFLFFASTIIAPPGSLRKEYRRIFMSERNGPNITDWSLPVLLPPGINSAADFDDGYPMIANDGKTIYFASNRNQTSGFDLFEATLPENIQSKIFHSFPGY